MFWRKKLAIEENPKDLSYEELEKLNVAIIAKLILIERELIGRMADLAKLAENLPNSGDSKHVFMEGAKKRLKFLQILEEELTYLTVTPYSRKKA